MRRLEAILEAAADGIHILSPDGHLVECSASFARMLGYTLAEAKTLKVADWDVALPADELPLIIQRLIERPETFETRHRRKDGSVLDVEISATAVSIEGNLYLYASARDISRRKAAERRLAEMEETYRQFFEVNTSVKLVIDPSDGRIVHANGAAAAFYGYPVAELEAMSIEQINCLPPAEVAREMQAAQAEKRLFFNFRHRLASGEVRDVEVYSGPVTAGGQHLLYSIIHDVTDRRLQQQALRDERRRLEAVLGSTTVAIAWARPTGEVEYVNPRFVEMFGYGKAEFRTLAEWWRLAIPNPVARAGLLDAWGRKVDAARDTQQPIAPVEVDITCSGGEVRTILLLASWAGTLLVLTFSDITAQRRRQQRIEHLAHHDLLTSLPNRGLFSRILRQGMAQATRWGTELAIAYLDLDGFKAINDAHGHDVGDQVLKVIAQRLRDVVRRADTVARLGGDEFALALSDLESVGHGGPLFTRILEVVAQPIPYQAEALRISASLGVTFYPQDDEVDGDQLLRQADLAMYQAKLAGKNRYRLFDVAHDKRLRSLHESQTRLRAALAAEQFVLHYQPQVNMHTGQVTGAEALIRWQHPTRGMLGPDTFLPVTQGTELGMLIGRWVIRRALQDMSAWHAAGHRIPVSVNVSPEQLVDPDFVDGLKAILRAYPEVPPDLLEMEIVETVALNDLARVRAVMGACRELGIRFAVDDFGTGYSSLSYLKDLPAGALKIDRSFVLDMLVDPDALAIVEGALGLARAFRRRVVAEGVETVAHGRLLLQLGCQVAQGFGIAKAMPAAALPGWIEAWRPSPVWVAQAPVPYETVPVLHAAVEHRAWILRLQDHLSGVASEPPPLDPNRCRFHEWLARERERRPDRREALAGLDALHLALHTQGRALVDRFRRTGHGPEPGAIEALAAARDQLLGDLDGYLQRSRPVGSALGHPR